LDLEATGIDPVKDRIIELAFVVVYPDGSRKRACRRFNPGMEIPPEATAVHHITDADVANCPPFADFAPQVVKALQGKDLAGYNLWRLDLPMLDEELRRCGLRLDIADSQVIDCYGIFANKEGRKLADAVKKYCGREHSDAHGAGEDAEATADVLFGQLSFYDDLADLELSKLAEFSRHGEVRYADLAGKLYYDADGDVCYAFGNSRNKKVRDDPGFAEWCLRKDFSGSTKEVLMAELDRISEDQSQGGKVWEG